MAKILKVGVIGVGGIARTHYPGWQQSPHTEIVAVADVHEPTATAAAESLGIPRAYTDPMEPTHRPPGPCRNLLWMIEPPWLTRH